MIKKELYPILEFDSSSHTVIDIIKNINSDELLPERCILSFFGESVKEYVDKNNCRQIGSLKLETIELPIFEIIINNEKVALIHALGSGPYAAGQIEKLSAMGCHKFMVCGGCGVIEKGSQCGEIYIPIAAVRDEGTSYHYVSPSREIKMNSKVLNNLCEFLDGRRISYRCVKTWTTDAMYRETKEMINLRREEGCSVVEMECASFFAVAQYKGIELGQILYAGDDLSGEKWYSRNWKCNFDARYNLLALSIEMVLLL